MHKYFPLHLAAACVPFAFLPRFEALAQTESALEDLRRIPKRFAAQNVAKISKLQDGLHGSIERLANFDCDYRLRCGDCRVLFDVEDGVMLVHPRAASQGGV